MLKKLACFMLCLLLPLTALAEESMLSKVMAVANRICMQADDETWLAMMLEDQQVRDLAAMIGGDHGQPQMVLEAEIEPYLVTSLGTQLAAEMGDAVMAACLTTEAQTIFAAELMGSGVYVLLYDAAAPILVTWGANGEAVLMSGLCLPHQDLQQCTSVEAVEAWFAERGLALSFCVPEQAAFSVPAPVERDMAVQAESLSEAMHELAGDSIAGAPAELQELLSGWASRNMGQPWLVMQGDASLRELAMMMLMDGDETSMTLVRRMIESVPAIFLSQLMGTAYLTASSMASVNGVIAASDAPDVGLVLLMYDEAVPVMVSWSAENGAVQMIAHYLPIDALMACHTHEAVAQWLDDQGLPLNWHRAN